MWPRALHLRAHMTVRWDSRPEALRASRTPNGTRYSVLVFLPTPSVCAEERGSDGSGLTLVRAQRVCVRPGWAEHRRLPRSEAKGTQTAGSPFLW